MNLILFDFDKTLTFTDTLLPLSLHLLKRTGKRYNYIKLIYNYLLFRLSLRDEDVVKKNFCSILVQGKSVNQIDVIVKDFYTEYSGRLFNPVTLKILTSEVNKGNHCFIISSNFSFFLQPLTNIFHINGVESTTAEVRNDIYTGLISGHNYSKQEKWERAVKLKTEFTYNEIAAYGDSRGDYEMLNNSDKAYLIKLITNKKYKLLFSRFYYLFGKIPNPGYKTEVIDYKA